MDIKVKMRNEKRCKEIVKYFLENCRDYIKRVKDVKTLSQNYVLKHLFFMYFLCRIKNVYHYTRYGLILRLFDDYTTWSRDPEK